MTTLAGELRFLSPAGKPGATAAVIEEARRRQRRRRLMGTVATSAVAVLAGAVLLGQQQFGQKSQPLTNAHGRSASAQPLITLYLRRDSSPAAIRNTIASVTHASGVARVTFVSREEALRTMKRRYPNLLSKITYNPLTDAIVVRLTSDRARASIVPHLKRLGVVEHIRFRTANTNK
jgi:cell division protein FtsX